MKGRKVARMEMDTKQVALSKTNINKNPDKPYYVQKALAEFALVEQMFNLK
jgi:hypothetical protein